MLDDEAENRSYQDHHEYDRDDLEESCPPESEGTRYLLDVTENVFPCSGDRVFCFRREEGYYARIGDEEIDEQDDCPFDHG